MRRPGRLVTSVVTALATVAALTAAPAASTPAPADYCHGQCADILPPGANGNATALGIIGDKLLGITPPHTGDQLGTYAALAKNYHGLTDAKLGAFFHDSAFGVPPGQVESVQRPRADVTIVRDRYGIPHVTGTTRAGTEYGAGYAAAADRLWMMDVFRHIGRGQLSGFAGGAAGNRSLEQQFYRQGAYQPGDFQAQVDRLRASGPRGEQAYTDILNYLAGLNQYIAHAKATGTFPGEYDLTGNANIFTGDGIRPFEPSDLLAIGTVISALFGSGGGGQVSAALVKQAAEKRYGTAVGDRVYAALREENDPEARLTLHNGQTFPYAASPAHPQGVAMPDPGSLRDQQLVFDPKGSAAGAASTTAAPSAKTAVAQENLRARPDLAAARGSLAHGVLPADLFSAHRGMSNALVVSGAHTASGHPVAVFGPQTGYFEPQLLMLEELRGPGIQARGAAFAGLNFYVQLGRGVDYSWSATSAGQDMTDTFAVPLCNTDGSPATIGSSGYLLHGRCTPMEPIARDDAWSPTIADNTPAGSYRLIALRTAYGMVQQRATVGGKPVAYTTLRSTYQHEADTLIGFQMYNDPAVITGPQQFQQAAAHIGYTFNWFYVDSAHTAYYNSGLNPTRAPDVDPNLPVWGLAPYEWRNWSPATNTVAGTPFAAHPNAIDQDYFVSWNNKIARGYTSAGFGTGAVHRANLLDDRVRALVARGGVTRSALTAAMEDAALTDLRAEDVLPLLLKVIGSAPVTDPAQAKAVEELSVWLGHGAKRTETALGSRRYADADAIRILDAWWPLLAAAEFRPGFGGELYDALAGAVAVDQAPSATHNGEGHQGSSFLGGWYSYVHRDLRSVLGQPVAGGPGITFCGGGDLGRCRAALLSSLSAAAATPAARVYPGDANCKAGDSWCADAIIQRPLGGLTVDPIAWQNRPTFQQVVEYPAHR